jgi:hypothetical protein
MIRYFCEALSLATSSTLHEKFRRFPGDRNLLTRIADSFAGIGAPGKPLTAVEEQSLHRERVSAVVGQTVGHFTTRSRFCKARPVDRL